MENHRNDIAILVENLTKRYSLYNKPLDRLKEVIYFNRRSFHREFTALDHINLLVRRGETWGIIGPNGAGKSTLLKVVAGIIEPTEGRCESYGKIAAIIELGAGFHPEFSGRENVIMNATLLGFRGTALKRILDKVERFSELGKYMDMPLKTYSTGMFMRLAFSVAINVEPEILLIDEALAVGDAVFAHRCISRLRQLQEQGVTILFVSHDVNSVMALCDHAIYLDKGRIIEEGEPKQVIQRYQLSIAERLSRVQAEGAQVVEFFEIGAPETSKEILERRFGTFEVRITDIKILNNKGNEQKKFVSGEEIICKLTLEFAVKIKNPVFGIMIKNRYGVEVFGTNTYLRREVTGEFSAGDIATVEFRTALNLCPGVYTLCFAVHTVGGHFYDYRVDAKVIEIVEPAPAIGIASLPVEIVWQKEHRTTHILDDDFIQKLYDNAPQRLVMDEYSAQFIIGDWYIPEQSPEGWFRWLGEEASVYLTVPENAQRFYCELRTFHPVATSEGLRVALKINGKIFDEFILNDNNWHRFESVLSPEMKKRINQFTLVASETFSPPGDDRRLSVQCRLCGVE